MAATKAKSMGGMSKEMLAERREILGRGLANVYRAASGVRLSSRYNDSASHVYMDAEALADLGATIRRNITVRGEVRTVRTALVERTKRLLERSLPIKGRSRARVLKRIYDEFEEARLDVNARFWYIKSYRESATKTR